MSVEVAVGLVCGGVGERTGKEGGSGTFHTRAIAACLLS